MSAERIRYYVDQANALASAARADTGLSLSERAQVSVQASYVFVGCVCGVYAAIDVATDKPLRSNYEYLVEVCETLKRGIVNPS
jgi:hypothetical protein